MDEPDDANGASGSGEPKFPGPRFGPAPRPRIAPSVAPAFAARSASVGARRPAFAGRLRAAPITFGLTALNVIVFLIAESRGSTTTAHTLLAFGAVESQHVWAGEYWRLATYMFLHIGWLHLVWNSYASIGWCMSVERELGHARFLAVYLLAGLAGGAASTVLPYAVSAGASGAMFGIIGAQLALRRRQLPSFGAAWADPGTRSTIISIGIWTAIGMTAMPMNNRAHFGGLVGGALATWIFTAPKSRRALYGLLYGAGFAVLLVLATRPWLRGTLSLPSSAARYPGGHGASSEAELERSTDLLMALCEKGEVAACHAVAIIMPAYAGDTTRDLEPACRETNDQDACAAWGWTLAHGRPGVPQDSARGDALMNDACKKGSAWGCDLAAGKAPVDRFAHGAPAKE